MSSDYATKSTVPMGNHQPYYTGGPRSMVCEAVASMVCGIVGLIFFGIILGPIAICLGVSAKNKIKENPQQLDGGCQATAGIVMGAIAVAVWALFIILYAVGAIAFTYTAS